jgi:uncharacterized membrane-anchored protein
MHDSWLIPLRDTHIPSPHQERVFLMSTHINLNKLPEITLAFWVMKICATTLGETAGDLLSMTLNVGYAMSSLILISAFLVTLGLQLFSRIIIRCCTGS